MSPDLTVGSCFSGVEGFGLGFERAGFKIKWMVEQDAFCRKILDTHWPKVPKHKDICKVSGSKLERVRVITGGVPCQDVSVAGKRTGLAGSRTGLVYQFARILQEVRPAWFVFENVPGLFSTHKGRDFAEVLRLFMVECGYGVSWRVLDSRYFGVAQRRRRVFLVGRLGEPCPAEILFDTKSGSWDLTARGVAGPDIAVPLTASAHESRPGRRLSDDFNIVRQAISSKWAKGSSGPSGDEHHNLVTGTIRENQYNTSQGPANYVTSTIRSGGGQAYRGDGSDNFVFESRFARNGRGAPSSIVPPLKAESGQTGKGDAAPLICFGPHGEDLTRSLSRVGGGDDFGANKGTLLSAPADSNRVRGASGVSEGVDDSPFATDFLPTKLDSARYRALGNAVTVSVAYWIARRIATWEMSNFT